MYLRFRYLLKHTIQDVEVPEDVEFTKKELIMVRTPDSSEDFGEVVAVFGNKAFLEPSPDFTYLRKANLADRETFDRHHEKCEEVLVQFGEKITQYKLDMHPIQVQLTKDGSSMHFMFSSEERVDFRELVKDLASTYKKKIYLQQVGARDRSRIVGGFGVCGRELCCTSFLYETPPVTMDSVRTQNIFYKDRDKLTGLCGKLKCCLNYELDLYAELRKTMPGVGSLVQIKSRAASKLMDRGKVIGISILDQLVRVFVEGNHETLTLPVGEVSIIERKDDEGSAVDEAKAASTSFAK